jgi:predicted HD phosphohydrolase
LRHCFPAHPGHGLLKVLAPIADGSLMGVPVNVNGRCSQTATPVLEAGGDREPRVVALFHDLSEALSDNDHAHVAAQILALWISECRSWWLTHHGVFLNFHFANHPTRDRNARHRYLGNSNLAQTAQFCELYDHNSFDPDYPTIQLGIRGDRADFLKGQQGKHEMG